MSTLAQILAAQGRTQEAISLATRSVEAYRARYGENDERTEEEERFLNELQQSGS
jgi:hypothetical protein